MESKVTLINDEWHSVYSYTSHNFNIPITSTLCGEKSTGTNRVIRFGLCVPTCPKCLKHMEDNTFVNFVGEIESKE